MAFRNPSDDSGGNSKASMFSKTHVSRSPWRSGLRALAWVFLITVLFHSPASAGLYLSPIEGLTTEWHPAPTETLVPLGTTLQLKLRVPVGHEVRWQGAAEWAEAGGWSVATFHLATPGPRTLVAEQIWPNGSRVTHECRLMVDPTPVEAIRVTGVRVSVEDLGLSGDDHEAAFQAFWRPSVAALSSTSDGRYVTSIHRRVHLTAEVSPPGFAPLVEWRSTDLGTPSKLGSQATFSFQQAGLYGISAGPPSNASAVQIRTYRVEITEPVHGRDEVPNGMPVTFVARTEPPGFENHVTWVASTKQGRVEPLRAQGPELTVVFEDTFDGPPGEGREWLGVRADHAAFEQDRKNEASWNRRFEAVTVTPTIFDFDGEALVTAFFSVTAENLVEPVDLSTEVHLMVNGENSATQIFDVGVAPPVSPQLGCFCDPTEICVSFQGFAWRCQDRFWVGCDPATIPLRPEDSIEVLLFPVEGSLPDFETRDDLGGALFEGSATLGLAPTCPQQPSAVFATDGVCEQTGIFVPSGSLAGQWRGRVVGQAVNFSIEMELIGSGPGNVGTWRLPASGTEAESRGIVTTEVDGSQVSLRFERVDGDLFFDADGSLQLAGTEIVATVDDSIFLTLRRRQDFVAP